MKALALEQLQNVWSKILKDAGGRKALEQLKKDGFAILDMIPQDPTFRQSNWADSIAAIPLLPNRPSRRRIHRKTTLQKHWPLVRALRRFAEKVDDPFCDKSIVSTKDCSLSELANLGRRLIETAEFVEKFLSWDWYTRDRNRRNALIAELRWQIRWRTSKPHDRELSALIDAAFRAAGSEEGFHIDATALDRIEKREKEGRVKATARLRSRVSVIPLSKERHLKRSTRFRQNPRKRV